MQQNNVQSVLIIHTEKLLSLSNWQNTTEQMNWLLCEITQHRTGRCL